MGRSGWRDLTGSLLEAGMGHTSLGAGRMRKLTDLAGLWLLRHGPKMGLVE